MRIGTQIFTVRDFCKTPEKLALSLKKVADIGYTTVQISGICPFECLHRSYQYLKACGFE